MPDAASLLFGVWFTLIGVPMAVFRRQYARLLVAGNELLWDRLFRSDEDLMRNCFGVAGTAMTLVGIAFIILGLTGS